MQIKLWTLWSNNYQEVLRAHRTSPKWRTMPFGTRRYSNRDRRFKYCRMLGEYL